MTQESTWLSFIRFQEVRARQITQCEVVQCYNGHRIGEVGDYVVLDDEDRVMIIKKAKFEHHYKLQTVEERV